MHPPHRALAAVLLTTAALLCRSAAAAEQELVVVTGSWCPYECAEGDAGEGLRGYLNDILVAVLADQPVTLRFVWTPFARGLEMVRENRGQVLVGIGHEDAPDLVYPELEQGLSVYGFFVRADSPWHFTGVSSFEQLQKVGVSQGEDYVELREAMARNPGRIDALPGEDRALRNLHKLIAGRVDAVITDSAVAEFARSRMPPQQASAVRAAGELRGTHIYVAFSPALVGAAQYAERMSRGTRELRSSGRLAEILSRYGLRDWRRP